MINQYHSHIINLVFRTKDHAEADEADTETGHET